jgi:hypothetical protein
MEQTYANGYRCQQNDILTPSTMKINKQAWIWFESAVPIEILNAIS